MSSKGVILYDIASKLSPQQWSPNTLKSRMVLNYLRIPYRTEWISYPDIEALYARHGLPPSNLPSHNFRASCTLPAVQHDEQWVADSFPIALHLSSAFSASGDRPSLFPHHSIPLAKLVQNYVSTVALPAVRKIILPLTPAILDDRGAEYFRRTRHEWEGVPLEELYADPQEQREIKADVTKILSFVAGLLRDNPEGPCLLGNELSYGDFVVVALLHWIRVSTESWWSDILTTHKELKALYERCQEYVQ